MLAACLDKSIQVWVNKMQQHQQPFDRSQFLLLINLGKVISNS